MKNAIEVSLVIETDRRQSTYTVVDGAEHSLAIETLPTLTERETLDVARRLFGEDVSLTWKI
jgi:hypothetical protein